MNYSLYKKNMNESKLELCELFIKNKNEIKKVFKYENTLLHICMSLIYSLRNIEVDADRLQKCKELVKEKNSSFSNFRGTAYGPISALLAISDDYNKKLDDYLLLYSLLKKEFHSNEYLPVVSTILADAIPSCEYESVVSKTKELYKAIRHNHPFLTSSEDQALCALLATQTNSVENIVNEIEENYSTLKKDFHSSNDVQALSHVLAYYDFESSSMKCEKVLNLYNLFKEAKRKYGKYSELPSLGVLAMSNMNASELVETTLQIDSWLATQKDFKGIFASVNKQQRLMFAAMLANSSSDNNVSATVATNNVISTIISQHTAIICCCCCCCISCTTSVASHS